MRKDFVGNELKFQWIFKKKIKWIPALFGTGPGVPYDLILSYFNN